MIEATPIMVSNYMYMRNQSDERKPQAIRQTGRSAGDMRSFREELERAQQTSASNNDARPGWTR